ncbi:MAG: branched-chain amino acid ABC transporter permease [Acholeplasma sp.]
MKENMMKLQKSLANYINLSNLPKILLFMFLMLVVPILLGFPASTLTFLTKFMVLSIVGLGFSILLGYTGLASLGTAGFIAIGTYTLGYLNNQMDMSLLVIILIGIAIALLLGAIVGVISLRIEGMYLAIITLGLSEIVIQFLRNAISITNGNGGLQLQGFSLFGISHSTVNLMYVEAFYIFIVIVLGVFMLLYSNIVTSQTGRAMLAVKNNTSAAQAMGISILKYRLLAFILATITAVVGGILYVAIDAYTEPNLWTLAISLNILAAIILGGSKSMWGVLIGMFIIFGLRDVVLVRVPFFAENGNAIFFFTGIIVILIVMYYPQGLIKLLEKLMYNVKTSIKKKIHKKGVLNHDVDKKD